MKLAPLVLALPALFAACSGKSGGERASGGDRGSSGDRASGGEPVSKPAGAGGAGGEAGAADPWSGSADVPPPKPPDKVVVDDPGAEPRRVLAYGLAPHERTLQVQVDPATQTIAWSCAAGGKCRYAVKSFMVGKDDEFQTLAKSIDGEATVTANGDVLVQPSSMMRLTPSPPELIKLAIAPLPLTAVGAGATWHVGERHYRVTKLSPLELAMTVAQDNETLEGTLAIDLAQPIATSMTMHDTLTLPAGGSGARDLPPITQTITLR